MPEQHVHLSVVVPVYCCARCLVELHTRLARVLGGITADYEIILVCDASPDDSWSVIQALATEDRRVHGLLLARNFGQHYAISAGLDQARGTWTVVMDCDLQDRPEEIPKLYDAALQGYDVVFGARAERNDGFFKRLGSRAFYRVLNFLGDAHHDARTANFGVYHRRVIDVVRNMREHNRVFPIQVKWAGFRQTVVDIQHDARPHGKSSYSLRRLFKLALDITLSYSDKPLRLSAYMGFFFSVSAAIYAVIMLIRYFTGEVSLLGYTSLIISIWLMGGLILFSLGVLGLYLGRVYEAAKGRPTYVIARTTRELPP